MMPLEFVGCIGGCDETLTEVLDLRYLRAGSGSGRGEDPQPPVLRPQRPQPPRAPASNPPPSWAAEPQYPPGGHGAPPDAGADVIVCNCGQDALLLTVRKDGPNQGRQFFKCSAGTCSFFLWADQPTQQGAQPSRGPPPRTSQAAWPSLGSGNTFGGGSGGQGGQTMCGCNEAAALRTVQKDGPNKGRMFHCCSKPREQQCGFFQWADENVPPPGRGPFHTVSCSVGGLALCSVQPCLDDLFYQIIVSTNQLRAGDVGRGHKHANRQGCFHISLKC